MKAVRHLFIYLFFYLNNTVERFDKMCTVPPPEWQPNGFIDRLETAVTHMY